MCGIAGVWSRSHLDDPCRIVGALDRALAHRGPDGAASHTDDEGRLVLVHRRLAIIEPGPAGRQPMSTSDGRFTIVYNGEIYNHDELRRGLEHAGESFATRSDTEVVLTLVARRGPGALADVRGMFALALWDARERALLVARDRFGIKPLYIAAGSRRVAFASEIRALLEAGLCSRDVDPAGVLAYLRWGSVPGPLTWLRDVIALEPGSWMRWSADGTSHSGRFADARQLWSNEREDGDLPLSELQARTRAALEDSVGAHLVADVPVGVFLSGGLDSSAITALAAQRSPGIATFTVVTSAGADGDARHAAEVAAHCGTAHYEIPVDPSDIVQQWPAILRRLDQPTGDGINAYVISRAVAASGIKTVLSGIGGDELFGGYPSFRRISRGMRWAHLPGGLRRLAALGVTATRRGPRGEKLRHAALHGRSPFELYRAARGWLMPREIDALAGPSLRARHAIETVAELEERLAAPAAGESVAAGIARLESTMYLRHQLLRDVDVMSMAHGLEVRVPLVDHALIGAVWPALGSHPTLLGVKRLLAESVGDLLPPAVATRRKLGFTLPFEAWLDGPLAPIVRDGLEHAARRGWLAPHAPEAILRAWRTRACHWSRPWGLAVLGHILHDARG